MSQVMLGQRQAGKQPTVKNCFPSLQDNHQLKLAVDNTKHLSGKRCLSH